MKGVISEWFYSALGGIKAAEGAIAFKEIIVAPKPVGDVEWVNAEHRSMYGYIKSSWCKSGNKFKLNVRIPVNTTALIYVPAKDWETVTEGGVQACGAEGVTLAGIEGDSAVFEVGSGDYAFVSQLP